MKIVTLILSLLDKFFGWRKNKSEDKEVKQSKKAKQDINSRDKHEKIVEKASETDDLEEIRKRASE